MNTKLTDILFVAIIIAALLWLLKCSDKFTKTSKSDTTIIEVTKWDTVEKHDTVYKPKWKPYTVTIHDTIHDSFPYPVGTVLSQTDDSLVIKNDSTDILVKYVILSENPLIKLTKSIDYKVRRKETTIIIDNDIVRKHALYIGPSLSFGPQNGFLMLDGSYEFKGKSQYNLGIGISPSFQPMLKVGMAWQILK
jgi:hypothetical protein